MGIDNKADRNRLILDLIAAAAVLLSNYLGASKEKVNNVTTKLLRYNLLMMKLVKMMTRSRAPTLFMIFKKTSSFSPILILLADTNTDANY